MDTNQLAKVYSLIILLLVFNFRSYRVFKGKELLYDNHTGDGFAYFSVDTLFLNSDHIPDFIFGYKMEDYSVIAALVSTGPGNYKELDIIHIFDPLTYDSTHPADNDSLYTFILKDVDNDNRRDIVTNVVISTGNDTWRVQHKQIRYCTAA